MKAGCVVLNTAKSLLNLSAKADKSLACELHNLLVRATDAMQLLGHASFEIVQLGREDIKPQLNKEYGDICSANVPVTEWLFGDDLQTKSRIFILPTELEVPLARPMDSTGGEIVLDQRRQPTVQALFYRERRCHWGGKTSRRGTTEASRIAGNNNATKHSGNRNPAHFYAPNHSSK